MFYPVSGEKLTHVPNVSLTYEMQVVVLSCSGLPRQKEISYRACRLAKDDLGRTFISTMFNVSAFSLIHLHKRGKIALGVMSEPALRAFSS